MIQVEKRFIYPNGCVCKSKKRKVIVVDNPNNPETVILQVLRLLDKKEQESIGNVDKFKLDGYLKSISKSCLLRNKVMFTETILSLDSAKLLLATLTTYINNYDNNRSIP